MANDLNNCSFIGRLGRDVDVRYLPNGDAVAGMALAVGSQWKDKNGDKQEATEWVNLTAFGKTGEMCGQYLKKGSRIFVSGRMKTDKFEDKDGVTKYSTKVVVEKIQFLDPKPEGQTQAPRPQDPRPERAAPRPAPADFDEDLPF